MDDDEIKNAPKKDMIQRQAQVELAGFQAQYVIQGRESIEQFGHGQEGAYLD